MEQSGELVHLNLGWHKERAQALAHTFKERKARVKTRWTDLRGSAETRCDLNQAEHQKKKKLNEMFYVWHGYQTEREVQAIRYAKIRPLSVFQFPGRYKLDKKYLLAPSSAEPDCFTRQHKFPLSVQRSQRKREKNHGAARSDGILLG